MFEQLIQGPADDSVTVAQQAAFSRFDAPDQLIGSPPAENPDYDLVLSYIKTAREQVERKTRFCLSTQKWKLFLPAFPNRVPYGCDPVLERIYGTFGQNVIELLRHPVQAIDEVKYLDSTGAEQTLDPATYDLVNDCIVLKVGSVWPVAAHRPDAVRIQTTVGYDDAGSPPNPTPESLKTALKFMAGWYWENRLPVSTQPTAEVLMTFSNLLKSFRSSYMAHADIPVIPCLR